MISHPSGPAETVPGVGRENLGLPDLASRELQALLVELLDVRHVHVGGVSGTYGVGQSVAAYMGSASVKVVGLDPVPKWRSVRHFRWPILCRDTSDIRSVAAA